MREPQQPLHTGSRVRSACLDHGLLATQAQVGCRKEGPSQLSRRRWLLVAHGRQGRAGGGGACCGSGSKELGGGSYRGRAGGGGAVAAVGAGHGAPPRPLLAGRRGLADGDGGGRSHCDLDGCYARWHAGTGGGRTGKGAGRQATRRGVELAQWGVLLESNALQAKWQERALHEGLKAHMNAEFCDETSSASLVPLLLSLACCLEGTCPERRNIPTARPQAHPLRWPVPINVPVCRRV
jgi:hypothetical protein